jgi:subtilase family serine protease
MAFKSDDLVFNTDSNGKITAGGFSVNSCLLKSGISPITTINNGTQKGGNVSAIFNNLAVPAGLLYMQQSLATAYSSGNGDETISDTLYDKLLNLATDKPEIQKKKKSRRNRKKAPQNNTRRRK